MRIHPIHVKSVFYVYSSEQAAREGHNEGACGFLVAISKQPLGENSATGEGFIYAVTNCHVIGHILQDGGTPHIRINSDNGEPLILGVPATAWKYHPDGDDIAIAEIDVEPPEMLYVSFPEHFVKPEYLEPNSWHIGPGDSVYMVGRFMHHDGKKINTPVVRYGNVSLNPGDGDKIYNRDTGHYDEVFLIESRSISGYSGSPVFVYIVPYDERNKPPEPEVHTFIVTGLTPRTRVFLLGINIGNTSGVKPVLMEKDKKEVPFRFDDGTGLWSEYNTGIMRIAPAWKIQELLDAEEFKMIRDKHSEKQKEKAEQHYKLDSEHSTKDMPVISRDEFMKSLKKTARKVNPSKSDQSKPKT